MSLGAPRIYTWTGFIRQFTQATTATYLLGLGDGTDGWRPPSAGFVSSSLVVARMWCGVKTEAQDGAGTQDIIITLWNGGTTATSDEVYQLTFDMDTTGEWQEQEAVVESDVMNASATVTSAGTDFLIVEVDKNNSNTFTARDIQVVLEFVRLAG